MPEDCQSLARGYCLKNLSEQCQRVSDNLYRHLQEGYPINKERDQLDAIPVKKLKAKIKIQGQFIVVKSMRGSSSN